MTEPREVARIIRVFVSSPGDVNAERAVLDEVVQRINETDQTGIRLDLFKWERNVAPRIGPPAQKVVDEQTPVYDIYLGIMAHRFGTPTGEHGSGTEKEFRDALRKWVKVGQPWILFYLDNSPVNPYELDDDQFSRVKAFRKELAATGLYATYQGVRGNPEAFFEKVEQHLRLIVQRIPPLRQGGQIGGPKRPTAAGPPIVSVPYRAWLQAQCVDVEFRSLRLKHGQSVRINHVYVPLTTSAGDGETSRQRDVRRRERKDPQLLLDLLGTRSLYVSGGPGSGKSMFCRWVAWLACAGAAPHHEIEAPQGYNETLDVSLRDRLPLLVRLRDFWPFLPTTPGFHELSRPELEHALGEWVQSKQPPNLTWPDVEAHVERGSALLILDGVDEVPLSQGEGRRVSHPRPLLLAGLVQAIPAWVRLGNRILLTSRPYGLDDAEARRLTIDQAAVEELSDEAQRLLTRRWFCVLAQDRAAAEATAGEMLVHVREREGLQPLTGNPMLLTAMCIVYDEGKRLPQDKHDLYARIVDNVLHNRYAGDPREIDLVRNRLCVIAHGMHTGGGLGERRSTPQAEAPYDEIDRMIQAYRDQSAWTEAGFKGAVEEREDLLSRSGLLLPRGGRRAGFYHLSFQDFLAAQRLLDLDRDRLGEAVRERASVPEWRPALSFVFGSLLAASRDRGAELVTELAELVQPEEFGLQVVLGEYIEMILALRIRHFAVEDHMRALCLSAIQREAPLRERHALALTLGRLGDPRVSDLRDRSAYVEVKAGEYLQGDNRLRRFVLDRPLLISRFPVTNSQFELFVKDGGYERKDLWYKRGRRWLAESRSREPAHWRQAKWNNPSQPVVGVSFWEAAAFCFWVGGRLPDEDEWECAARGPEALEYPWGNEWEDGVCNTREARLGMTSAVGLFPRSRSSAFGLEDMAGNVLEWCGDLYATKSGDMRNVARGGSWAIGACRCAYRSELLPGYRDSDIGFRIVAGIDVPT